MISFKDGQLQNNTFNGAMSVSINRVIIHLIVIECAKLFLSIN